MKRMRDFIGKMLRLKNFAAEDMEVSCPDTGDPLQSQSAGDSTEMAGATPNISPKKRMKEIVIYAWGHIRRLENHFLLCKDLFKERLTEDDIQLLIEEAMKHEGFDKLDENDSAIVQKRRELMAEQRPLPELSDEYENCSSQDEAPLLERAGLSHG